MANFFPLEHVSHLVALCVHVRQVVFGRLDRDRNALDDLQPETLEAGDLLGVVRQQSHLVNPEVGENLRTDAVIALIGREPEQHVGFDRIGAAVLQCIGAQLVGEADAAAFLMQIEQHAAAFFGNRGECRLALRGTIAADRVQRIAG
jgi:hypothetical protein